MLIAAIQHGLHALQSPLPTAHADCGLVQEYSTPNIAAEHDHICPTQNAGFGVYRAAHSRQVVSISY